MQLDEPPRWRIPRKPYPQVTRVDMSGRVCVVTGASSGIGLQTAVRLAEWGAQVCVVGRNPKRTEECAKAVADYTGNPDVSFALADFASLRAVQALAAELKGRFPRIHVLVNNAGLWLTKREVSTDGFEMTFAVNHLAPFLLTQELLDVLTRSAPARIVNVSSRLHEKEPRLRLDDLQIEQRKYGGIEAYRQSKLANVVFSNELAARLRGTGVTSNAVHPGDVATAVVRDSGILSWGIDAVGKRWLLTPEEGARTTVHVATHPSLEKVTGRYFAKVAEGVPNPASHDLATCAQLWRMSEDMVEQALER